VFPSVRLLARVDHSRSLGSCLAEIFHPTRAFSQPQPLICGASAERVPLVSERIRLAPCLYEIGRRERGGAARGSASCPRVKLTIRISVCSPSCGEDGRGVVAAVAGYGDPVFPAVEGPGLADGERGAAPGCSYLLWPGLAVGFHLQASSTWRVLVDGRVLSYRRWHGRGGMLSSTGVGMAVEACSPSLPIPDLPFLSEPALLLLPSSLFSRYFSSLLLLLCSSPDLLSLPLLEPMNSTRAGAG
jgi:hypothetical protein